MTTLRVFLSHSNEDNDFGLRFMHDLQRALGGNGDTVWYDKAGGLRGGDNWWRIILKEIPARPVFIVILSPSAMTSSWVNDEIDIAWRLKNSPAGKLILPVLYQECDIRLDLEGVQYVSFVAPRAYDDAFQEVLSVLDAYQPTVAGAVTIGTQTNVTQSMTTQRSTQNTESHVAELLDLLAPLHLAFKHDLEALVRYWDEVFYGPDMNTEEFEKYHRLAFNPLPTWQHPWYEAQVKARITDLDPDAFGRIHALLERLSLVDLYRGRMRTQFEANDTRQLWHEYIHWKQVYTSGAIEERIAAQAQYCPLSKRLNDFCLANVELWNAFAALMNLIREAGNPIAPLSENEARVAASIDSTQRSPQLSQVVESETHDTQARPAVVPMTAPPLRDSEEGVEYFDPDFSQHQQALLNAGKEPAFNIWGVLFGPKQAESAHVLDRRRTLSYGGPLMSEQLHEVSASPGRTVVAGDVSIDSDPAHCLHAPPEPSLGAMLYHDAPRILARCTITYRDMHGNIYATISDFTANHEWQHTFVAPIQKGLDELDDEARERLFPQGTPN